MQAYPGCGIVLSTFCNVQFKSEKQTYIHNLFSSSNSIAVLLTKTMTVQSS